MCVVPVYYMYGHRFLEPSIFLCFEFPCNDFTRRFSVINPFEAMSRVIYISERKQTYVLWYSLLLVCSIDNRILNWVKKYCICPFESYWCMFTDCFSTARPILTYLFDLRRHVLAAVLQYWNWANIDSAPTEQYIF